MTLEDVAYVAQITGVLVVAATLIYLTIQVKQGAEVLRSDSRQAQHANDQTGVYKFVENPDLARAYSQKAKPAFEDKVKLMFWLIGQMRTREHEWLQYKSGALDKETWENYRGVIFFILGTTRGRDLWKLCNPFFNAEFVAMVAGMMNGVPTIDYWEQLEAID